VKIQLASDWHLELLAKRIPQMPIVEPVPEADMLVSIEHRRLQSGLRAQGDPSYTLELG